MIQFMIFFLMVAGAVTALAALVVDRVSVAVAGMVMVATAVALAAGVL